MDHLLYKCLSHDQCPGGRGGRGGAFEHPEGIFMRPLLAKKFFFRNRKHNGIISFFLYFSSYISIYQFFRTQTENKRRNNTSKKVWCDFLPFVLRLFSFFFRIFVILFLFFFIGRRAIKERISCHAFSSITNILSTSDIFDKKATRGPSSPRGTLETHEKERKGF